GCQTQDRKGDRRRAAATSPSHAEAPTASNRSRIETFIRRSQGYSSEDASAAPGDSLSPSPAPPSPSAIASSMADSKSSPRSSPNSRPIFFMNRATLDGSFSSRSPRLDESARASSRASSDFTVAKRDITRESPWLPHRGQAGDSAAEGRSTRRLTRLR